MTLEPVIGRATSLTIRTDNNGAFEFREIVPGPYRIRAIRTGYVQASPGESQRDDIKVEASDVPIRIEVRLSPAGVITGKIYDEDNDGVEGLIVQAWRLRFQPGGRHTRSVVRSTATDDLGTYRLAALAPGKYLVQVTGRASVSIGGPVASSVYLSAFHPYGASMDTATPIQVRVGEETRGIDVGVRIGPTWSIIGTVTDLTPEAAGRRYSVGFAQSGSLLMQFTEPGGRFLLPGLEPGDYMLVAEAVGSAGTEWGYLPVRLVDGDLSVSVEIGRTSEVRGDVQMVSGAALPSGLGVKLTPQTEQSVVSSSAIKDGRFLMSHVPEGEYHFELTGGPRQLYLKEARCGGATYTVGTYRLAAGQREQCTLLVGSDTGSVSGTVERDNVPVGGAAVVLIPVEIDRRRLPRQTMSEETDKTGRFSMEGVVPGEYLAFAVAGSEDAAFYELEFAERNKTRAVRVVVGPGSVSAVTLTLLSDRQ